MKFSPPERTSENAASGSTNKTSAQAAKSAPAAAGSQKGWVKPEKVKAVQGEGKKKEKEKAPAAAAAAPAPAGGAPAASAPAPAAAGPTLTKGTPEDHAALQAAKELVMKLKAEKGDKGAIDAAVAEMLRLKDVCGEVAPAKDKKKKK